MVKAAYNANVYISGTAVPFTDLTTTKSGNDYQITDTTKRLLTGSVVVKVNNVITTSGFTINNLFGIISFTSPQTQAVTISGSYLPLARLTSSRSYDIKLTSTALDSTTLGSNGFKNNILGLRMAEITLKNLFDGDNNLTNHITSRSNFVIELDNDIKLIRGLFILTSEMIKSPIDQLIEGELTLKLSETDNTQISIINK